MATQIDSLEINIQASSKKATSALSELQQILEKIKTTTSGGLGLSKVVTEINNTTAASEKLAKSVSSSNTALSKMPTATNSSAKSTDKYTSSNIAASVSLMGFVTKLRLAMYAAQALGNFIGNRITDASNYIEDVNLFTVSLGDYATSAKEYAELASSSLGIDVGSFMRTQGVLQTISEGFGIASDRAYTMSRNLTQLAYDLSSFDNLSTDDAIKKVQSGLSGELEPLRAVGYDLSQARLEAIALSLGIDKTFSSMTQAEKAQLRYYAMMTQVTSVQQDMARSLDAPANQLRIFQAQLQQTSRAIGNIFIPALLKILPYVTAVLKVVGTLAQTIATLFGFKITPLAEISSNNAGAALATNMDDAATGVGKAAQNAKKLKSYLLGIDELNVIAPEEPTSRSGGSGSGSSGGGGGFDFDLPEYTFFDEVESKVDAIIAKWQPAITWMQDHMSQILATAGAIGVAFAAWHIAKSVTDFFNTLSNFKGFSNGVFMLGALALIGDVLQFAKYLEDFIDNGATFTNVVGMISSFAGMLGDAFLMLGNVKMSAALKVVQGAGEIAIAIKQIADGEADIETATTAVRGLSNLFMAFGIYKKNAQLVGGAIAIQGILTIIENAESIITAFKTGDWSGVDKVAIGVAAIQIIGGGLAVLGKIKFPGSSKMNNTAKKMKEASESTSTVTETATNNLLPKLKELAKNMAMGIVIIAEVAAAAVLIVGAIWLLGVMLEQVGLAWQPVIDNGATILIALGLGTALLAAVGVATYALGQVGTSLIVSMALGIAVLALVGASATLFLAEIWLIGFGLEQIGQAWQPVIDNQETVITGLVLGTAVLAAVGVVTGILGSVGAPLVPILGIGIVVLAEIGIAAGLFLAEIIIVGKMLEQVGVAWQPVIDNQDTIVKGITLGTAALVAVGVVSALLGVATVATAGLLPVAIGLGTAMLILLSAAFIEFTNSLISVANQLSSNLSPALSNVNIVLPTLSTNMSSFVDFMSDFAGEIVRYTGVSAIAGISATIDTIIGWFTQDPIDKLTKDVNKIYTQALALNGQLNLAVPELEEAIGLFSSYKNFLSQLATMMGVEGSAATLASGTFVNMKEVGQQLVTGFVAGIRSKSSDFSNVATEITTGFNNKLTTSLTTSQPIIVTWGTSLKNWFTLMTFGAINAQTFAKYAEDIVNGFKNSLSSKYSSTYQTMITWGNGLKNAFITQGEVNEGVYSNLAASIVNGFNNGIQSNMSNANNTMVNFGKNIYSSFDNANGKPMYNQFYNNGRNVVQGFIDGVNSLWDAAMKRMKEFSKAALKTSKDEMGIASPSKETYSQGVFVVLGFANAIQDKIYMVEDVMSEMANIVNSNLNNMNTDFLSDGNISIDSSLSTMNTSYIDGAFEKALTSSLNTFYQDNLSTMNENVRIQAEKKENTIVQIGTDIVSNAVSEQSFANGYKFT